MNGAILLMLSLAVVAIAAIQVLITRKLIKLDRGLEKTTALAVHANKRATEAIDKVDGAHKRCNGLTGHIIKLARINKLKYESPYKRDDNGPLV